MSACEQTSSSFFVAKCDNGQSTDVDNVEFIDRRLSSAMSSTDTYTVFTPGVGCQTEKSTIRGHYKWSVKGLVLSLIRSSRF